MNMSKHKIWQWLATAREWILFPVKREPVFFLTLMVLFGLGQAFNVGYNYYISNDVALWQAIKSVAVVTLVSYLLTWLATSSRYVKVVLYVLALLFKFVMLFVKNNFLSDFNPVILQAMCETDSAEASDFVGLYAFSKATIKAYIYIAVCIVVIIAGERWFSKVVRWFNRKWQRVLMALFLLITLPYGIVQACHQTYLFTPSAIFDDIFIYYHYGPTDALSNVVHSVLVVKNVEKEAQIEYGVTEKAMKQPSVCEETDTLHVVVVIGETYIKCHAGIYGYSLPTTPNLSAELEADNLFLFHDIVASHCNTSESLKRVLSTNSEADGQKWYDYPFFPTLFKKAGFFVTYWDNQWDSRKVNIYDFSLGAIVHNKRMMPYSFDMDNEKRYPFDKELLDSYLKEAHGKAMQHRLSLSLFHLMGQHMYAHNRFPDEPRYKPFNAASIKRTEPWLDEDKKQYIANYDNATHYNDMVMGQLLDTLRNTCAVVVYFSDHGEEIYDWQDFAGRDERAYKPRQSMELQYCVPFMVWCSPAFKQRYPECIERLRGASQRKGLLDDLPHMLMDLARIKSNYYVAEHDLISPFYKPSKRIVQDIADYDEVISMEQRARGQK